MSISDTQGAHGGTLGMSIRQTQSVRQNEGYRVPATLWMHQVQELWLGAQKALPRSKCHASVIQVENLLSGGPYPISDQSDHPKPEAAQSQL